MSDDYIRDLPERPSVNVRKFDWPGPVAKAFGENWADPIVGIMGPQGGGKTTTCCMKIIRSAARMPRCRDGVRRSRWLVVRDTYDRLYRSAVASWLSLVPKTAGDWEGGQGRPAKHRVVWERPNGYIDLEMNFVAIGDQAAEDVMRGYEYSGLWINEGDRTSEDVLTFGVGRGLRYPPKSMSMPGEPEPRLLTLLDFNAPDVDNWIYKRFIEMPQPGHKLYRQPGGRSPNAENLANLRPSGEEYYAEQIRLNGSKADWIRRFVDNEFGFSRDGEPVYPEFMDLTHVAAEPFGFLPHLPVTVGLDAGLHPAAVFTQTTPKGQVRVPAEIAPGRMGTTRFTEITKRFIAETIPPSCRLLGYADPSAAYGADKQGGELSWIETMQHGLGFPILEAPSNEIGLRLDAVRQPLGTLIDGEPGFLLSPSCKVLRRGFNSKYCFVRVRGVNGDTYRDTPAKTDESHPHDALQYACLGTRGRYAVIHNDRPGFAGAPARTVVPQMRVRL